MDAAILEKEALLLPEAERALLVERLLQSISQISPGLQAAWIREADERVQAFRDGVIDAVDGPQALAALRARLAE